MNVEEQVVQEVQEVDQVVAARVRVDPIQAEQELCNAALESGSFDTMSDAEWVELCRRAAAGEKVDFVTQ